MRDCRRLYPHALYMGVGGSWQVNIVGSRDGYFTPEQRRIVRTHSRQRAKIVTVAMGSPRRDLYARLPAPVSARAVYGRRRHLRCFTGHVHRAPKFWQDLGLEWFYRLLLQPSRIKRQFRLLRFTLALFR